MTLLDTSGLLCYHHRDEIGHRDAVRHLESTGAKLIHNYVLAEFVALVRARRMPMGPALRFLQSLLAHPEVEVVWVDEALHGEATALLEARHDKTYSLCDAVSFVLMRRGAIRNALTTDRHFEQEGFRRLINPVRRHP